MAALLDTAGAATCPCLRLPGQPGGEGEAGADADTEQEGHVVVVEGVAVRQVWPVVHAFNCLRHAFNDRHLSVDTSGYFAQAIQVGTCGSMGRLAVTWRPGTCSKVENAAVGPLRSGQLTVHSPVYPHPLKHMSCAGLPPRAALPLLGGAQQRHAVPHRPHHPRAGIQERQQKRDVPQGGVRWVSGDADWWLGCW